MAVEYQFKGLGLNWDASSVPFPCHVQFILIVTFCLHLCDEFNKLTKWYEHFCNVLQYMNRQLQYVMMVIII